MFKSSGLNTQATLPINSMWRTTETEKKLFQLLSKKNDTFIVFDVETSGLSVEKDRIIQISAIKYLIGDDYQLHKLNEFNEYINPGFYVSEKITELTDITNDFLETQPSEEDIFPVIYSFFGESPNLAAYNSNFDIGFLNACYERNGARLNGTLRNSKGVVNNLTTAVDVLQMARDLVDKKDTENFKLRTICELYGLAEGIEWHNANGDVEATGQLMQVFISEYQNRQNAVTMVPKQNATVLSVRYWEGFRGFSRIYVNTNIGTIYYDIRNKVWGEKDTGVIDQINMEKLRQDILQKYSVTSEDELASKLRKVS